MFICLCNGIPEESIRQAVREGAHTLEDLSARLGVATGCGGCALLAEEIIDEVRAEMAAAQRRAA